MAIACARWATGRSLGDFSLTIVLYGREKATVDREIAEFARYFTNADGNPLRRDLQPAQCALRHRSRQLRPEPPPMYLLTSNYADLSFLFTILPGEKTNPHLGTEYLAALETDNATPYFLNLHNGEVAHTLILGTTGSGKSFLAISCSPKRTEVRAAHLHLRYRRQISIADDISSAAAI